MNANSYEKLTQKDEIKDDIDECLSFSRGIHTVDESWTIKEASVAYVQKRYNAAAHKYKIAIKTVDEIRQKSNGSLNTLTNNSNGFNHVEEDDRPRNVDILVILRYMLCASLSHSKEHEDLLEALNILQKLEESSGTLFPAVYYALAKLHIKLYRFDAALDAISKGLTVLNKGMDLQEEKIPMENISIPETTKEGLSIGLVNLQNEALGWHRPDAKCNLVDCQNSTPHYPPNRDIYFNDPAFNGLVIVTCSNASYPCKLKFHPACWKYQKEKMSTVKKLPDKEAIGSPCLTSNCESNGSPNTIQRIEILDEKANFKSVIDGQNCMMHLSSSVKGAIKKNQSTPNVKLRRPNIQKSNPQEQRSSATETTSTEESDWEKKLMKLTNLRENNFGISPEENWRPDEDMFGNEYMLVVRDYLPEPDFTDDDEDTMNQKRFLFEILYEYIKSNAPVHVSKVLSQWCETREMLHSSSKLDNYLDADILTFLLQSPKIVMVDDYMCIPQSLRDTYQLVKTQRIEQYKAVKRMVQNGVDANVKDASEKEINKSAENKDCNLNNVNQSSGDAKVYINAVEAFSNMAQAEAKVVANIAEENVKINDKCDINQNYKCAKDSPIDKNNPNITEFVKDLEKQLKARSTDSPYKSDSSVKDYKMEYTTSVDFERLIAGREDCQSRNSLHSPKEKTAVENECTDLTKENFTLKTKVSELLKERKQMEHIFRMELATKDSGMIAIARERDLLLQNLQNLQTIYSNGSENTAIKSELLSKTVITLRSEMSSLLQDKLDNEHNIQVLSNELKSSKRIFNEERKLLTKQLELLKTVEDRKNEEIGTLHVQLLNMKKQLSLKTLEFQYLLNKNFILRGIKHCENSLDVLCKLTYLIETTLGFHAYLDNSEWSQALNQFQQLLKDQEIKYANCKQTINTTQCDMDLNELTLSSVNLPPYPNKPLSTVVCEAFVKLHAQMFHQFKLMHDVTCLSRSQLNVGFPSQPQTFPLIYNEKNQYQNNSVSQPEDNKQQSSSNNAENISSENAYNQTKLKDENKDQDSDTADKITHGKNLLFNEEENKECEQYEANVQIEETEESTVDLVPWTEVTQRVRKLSNPSLVNVPVQNVVKNVTNLPDKTLKRSTISTKAHKNVSKAKSKSQNAKKATQSEKKNGATIVAGSFKEAPPPAKCAWESIPLQQADQKKENTDTECVICMEFLNKSQKIHILSCQHSFHRTCIKNWLEINKSCPTCRVHCPMDGDYPPLL